MAAGTAHLPSLSMENVKKANIFLRILPKPKYKFGEFPKEISTKLALAGGRKALFLSQ